MTEARPVTIAILAMGGEGGGVLADWIVDMAEHAGHDAQATSVPGVAQRTGSTIYYLEIFPRTAGKQPVFSLMPVPGEVDVVIASELMEAGRAVQRGLVTPDRTVLIASIHRVYSISERTAIGDGRADSEKLRQACSAAARVLIARDFARVAAEERSVISAALFGALAALRVLPFERKQFEEAIRRGGVGVEASLRAFGAGFDLEPEPPEKPQDLPNVPKALARRIESKFPPQSWTTLRLAAHRLADYQDEAYAAEYLNRLDPVRDADESPFALLNETARQLALWMSYEDAIRVADLKIRRARYDRIHREVRAEPEQVIQIREFLHPRAQEIADILPPALGKRVLASELVKRMTRTGRIVETTSIRGFLQLFWLARMQRLRRWSMRFAREHAKIGEWLALIKSAAPRDRELAIEIARCAQLLKGYGATRQLGEQNFEAILAAARQLSGSGAAERVRILREAALADESGEKLRDALAPPQFQP